MYILLLDANPFSSSLLAHRVGEPSSVITLEEIFNELVALVAERNPDFYENVNGEIKRAS